ncbi:glycoside hydrolase family 2 TIM barrel-domain containing protein [Nonomuraea sp. NPDC003709]|uniref:glycoside hydrolase family 2 protein n=1 Tax=Nonomuraea sp. NPDC003709 TaxID=3154450 RepID=UPI0033AA4680
MTRRRELINRAWKFAYGDPAGAVAEDFDDGDLYDVGLPHSFGIPYFMETGFYVGRGVYRRVLDIRPEDLGKYLALEFQGVFQDAEVYVNGSQVGRHLGGYTAFAIDISTAVRAGANQLAVRVSNEWNPRLAPRAGEHTFNGGIYRDVALIVAERTRIAWYGTFVTTRQLLDGDAVIDVATELVNDGDADFEGDLTAEIHLAGEPVLRLRQSVSVPAGATSTCRQEFTLRQARLWHPDTPHLYTLEQRLTQDERCLDEAVTTFGVRTAEFTTDKGFFLNGEHLPIHGANVHQDRAGWCDAATHSGIRRDVALIRESGMNFIRGSHYPHHEQFAAECDRQGVLFWSELCFWGIGGESAEGFWTASAYPPHEADRAEFEDSCLRAMAEMIRVNRNHPSIIAWSTGNEVFFSDDEVIPQAKDLTRRLVDLVHELDPTRPAAVGGAQRRGFDELGDVAGYNGDGASLYHKPPWPNLVSEYGSLIEDRPGAYGPRYAHGVETPHPWRSGIVLWCGMHHGSIVADMSRMGFIDYFRLPLRSWYWYRRELRGVEPPPWPLPGTATALRLSADRMTIATDGTDDTQIMVELLDASGHVVADERPVRIEVVEGGGVFPTGTSITLSPENRGLLDGIGAIEFRSYFAGPNTLRAGADGLAPAELTIEAVGGEQWRGRPRRLAPGPPSRSFVPSSDAPRLLSAKRPVFSSGSLADRPAHLITDYSTGEGWISATNRPGAWIRVDLEGLWRVDTVTVLLGEPDAVPYRLEVSGGQAAEEVAAGTTERRMSFDLRGRALHAVKLVFPEAPAEVKEVRVHGR